MASIFVMKSDAQVPSVTPTGQHLIALLMQLSLIPNLLQLPTGTSLKHQRVNTDLICGEVHGLSP